MSEIPSIEELLEMVLQESFEGVKIDPSALKNEASRTEFICSQADRLFYEERKDPTPNHSVFNFYSFFIEVVDSVEQRRRPDSPFSDPQQVATLSDDDQLLCDALGDLAALLGLLDYRQPFNFDLIGLEEPGIFDDWGEEMTSFTMSNPVLVDFVRLTPYRLLAAHVAATMVEVKLDLVIGRNLVMQDLLAQEGNGAFRRFMNAEMGTEEYIYYALATLRRIARHEHLAEERYGMDVDTLALNDIMSYSLISDPRDEFNDEVVALAQQLNAHINRHLDIKPDRKEFETDCLQSVKPQLAELPFLHEEMVYRYLAEFINLKYQDLYA